MQARSITAISMFVILAACSGGGGGGGSTDTPGTFTSFSELPADGRTELDGQAITVSTTVNLAGDISIGTPSNTTPGSVILTTAGGDIVGIVIDARGNNPTSQLDIGGDPTDTISTSSDITTFTAGAGDQLAVVVEPTAAGYEYQTYGLWANAPSSFNTTLGTGSYGASTPTTGVPASGTIASYSGASVGVAEVGGDTYITASSVQVTTDFNTATVNSSATEGSLLTVPVAVTPANTPLPQLDFNGAGPVSGNGFSANVVGLGVTGDVDGQFYGPAAEEVGGTFSASGTGIDYFGSFGARQ